MRLLLDTHALLWFVEGSSQLPARTRNLLFEEQDDVFVSTASIWEIAIKTSVGKLRFAADIGPFFKTEMARNSFLSLPITHEHAARVATLPLHHRDPFDRMLAAQCDVERLAIVSRDPSFDAYGIKRLW
jgi:PIN domain nuclease of toxin-antitoxin system